MSPWLQDSQDDGRPGNEGTGLEDLFGDPSPKTIFRCQLSSENLAELLNPPPPVAQESNVKSLEELGGIDPYEAPSEETKIEDGGQPENGEVGETAKTIEIEKPASPNPAGPLAEQVSAHEAATASEADSGNAKKRKRSESEILKHRESSKAWHLKWEKKGVPRTTPPSEVAPSDALQPLKVDIDPDMMQEEWQRGSSLNMCF